MDTPQNEQYDALEGLIRAVIDPSLPDVSADRRDAITNRLALSIYVAIIPPLRQAGLVTP